MADGDLAAVDDVFCDGGGEAEGVRLGTVQPPRGQSESRRAKGDLPGMYLSRGRHSHRLRCTAARWSDVVSSAEALEAKSEENQLSRFVLRALRRAPHPEVVVSETVRRSIMIDEFRRSRRFDAPARVARGRKFQFVGTRARRITLLAV